MSDDGAPAVEEKKKRGRPAKGGGANDTNKVKTLFCSLRKTIDCYKLFRSIKTGSG